jgi:hypothetical protein
MYHLTEKSRNVKTGPIPVSTSTRTTCPDACPFKGNGCYAESGPLALHWKQVTENKRGDNWKGFINKIRALPTGQLWRHNQGGDLPGEGDKLDITMLQQLISANMGKKGFTYTHKPLTGKGDKLAIMHANNNGFTINLSANNLKHADDLADLNIGPVVVVTPYDSQALVTLTPKGRKVVTCPATYRDDVSCATCKLCARDMRDCIVAFPAHGASKRKASAIANNAKQLEGV